MKKTIVCLGELLIDFVPMENGLPLERVPLFQRSAGGAPANVASAVAKLGGSARFIGKIGRDAFGRYLRDTLIEAGVDAALVETDEANTGLAFVSLKADGERDFMFYRTPAADMLLSAAEIRDEWLADAAIYHFGSVSLIEEPCRTATIAAARRIREEGGIVSYDPNLRPALWPNEAKMKSEILANFDQADIVKVNEEEMAVLLHEDAAVGARMILERGVSAVIVTMAAEGCRVITRQNDIRVPGFPVHTVDTTGAGDSFVGAVLYQLVQRSIAVGDLANRLADETEVFGMFSFANKAGALTTTRRGAIPALPTLEEIGRI
jgi:fructokinase